jgi:hypothetical protein
MEAERWNGDGQLPADIENGRTLFSPDSFSIDCQINHISINQCQISKPKFQMNAK